MWPLLLILAIVPMFFFWSSNIKEALPELSQYLPEETAEVQVTSNDIARAALPPSMAGAEPGQWYILETSEGYVAWTLSDNWKYRTLVGCHAGAPAVLQVAHVSSKALPAHLTVNYQYGMLPLEQGQYTGPDIVNGVAQFKVFQLISKTNVTLAQFKVPGPASNGVARALSNICAPDQ